MRHVKHGDAQLVPQALAYLPRGRAWSTREGGPQPSEPLFQYWLAVSVVFAFMASRLCDMLREFFCQTIVETRDAADGKR